MKEKLLFISRLILYVLLGLGCPVTYLVIKFKLFESATKTSFSGWMLVLILFCCIFLICLLNQIKKGMKPGIGKQILKTVCNITIPLGLVAWILWWMEGYLKDIQKFFVILVMAETAAGMVNPIPMWAFKNNIDIHQIGFIKSMEQFFKKKND